MLRWFMRHRLGVRVIALAVTGAFLYSEAVQAQGLSSYPVMGGSDATSQSYFNSPLHELELSPEIGQLQDVFFSSSDKEENPFVIHIQDSHANYPAQQNIVKILNRIMNGNGESLEGEVVLCLEGANGVIDPSFFQIFSDRNAKKSVAEHYLLQGKVTAAEYFAMTQEKEISLRGIEDPALYRENLDLYSQVRDLQKQAQSALNEKKQHLSLERKRQLPQKFLTLEQEREKLDNQQISLSRYLDILALEVGIDESKYPLLGNLSDLLELQSQIDNKKVSKERTALLGKLKKRLVKEEIADLIKISLEYRLGKTGSLQYHSTLLNYAQMAHLQNGVPNLTRMVRFLERQNGLNMSQAMAELEKLNQEVKNLLLVEQHQKALQIHWEWLVLAGKLVRLEVTPVELKQIDEHQDEIVSFLRNNGAVVEAIDAARQFYAIAQKRDAALVKNTLRVLKEEKRQIAILITGGFHTDGLLAQLKEAGSSHAVIAPHLTEQSDEVLYASLMEPELSPLQRILTSTGNRLAAPSYLFAETILGNRPEIRLQMQEADLSLILLQYLGYQAATLKEQGKNPKEIQAALTDEMESFLRQFESSKISIDKPIRNYQWWNRLFKEIAFADLPRGLFLSKGDVALIVTQGKEEFKSALESYALGQMEFAVGETTELKAEAETPRTWLQQKKAKEAEARLAKEEAKRKELEVKLSGEKIDKAEARKQIEEFLSSVEQVLAKGVHIETLELALAQMEQINWDLVALAFEDDPNRMGELEAIETRVEAIKGKIVQALTTPKVKKPVLSMVGPASKVFVTQLFLLSILPVFLSAAGSGVGAALGYYTGAFLITFFGFSINLARKVRARNREIAASPRGQAAQAAESLLYVFRKLYKEASELMFDLETEDFLLSYQNASDLNLLGDPEQLQTLLEIVDAPQLASIQTEYPWFELKVDEKYSPSQITQTLAYLKRDIRSIQTDATIKAETKKEVISNAQRFLRFVMFLHHLERIKEKDIQEAERKIAEAEDKNVARVALQEDQSIPHPFWGPEIPYTPDEAVFHVRFAKVDDKLGYGYSENEFVVDLAQWQPTAFAKRVKKEVRQYLKDNLKRAQKAESEVKKWVAEYEEAIRSGDKVKQKEKLENLKNKTEGNKVDQQFYRQLISQELEKIVWDFGQDLSETLWGIYTYSREGAVGSAIGKLIQLGLLAAIGLTLIGGVFGVALAQDGEPGVDKDRDGADVQVPPIDHPGERADRGPDAARAPPVRKPTEAEAAQLNNAISQLRDAIKIVEGQIQEERRRLGAGVVSNQARKRLRESLRKTNEEFFAVGVNLAESPRRIGSEQQMVPTAGYGSIVRSFRTYDEFQNWLFENLNKIRMYRDLDGQVIQDATQILQMIRNRQGYSIWVGDRNNRNQIVDGVPQAYRMEFGAKAKRDTAGVARSDLRVQERKINHRRELSSRGGPVARFVHMLDSNRRYETAPPLHVPGMRQPISSTFGNFEALSVLPKENFRFYKWPSDEISQIAGRIVRGDRITSMDELRRMERDQRPYQVWYLDAETGVEYFMLTGENAVQAKLQQNQSYLAGRQIEFNVMEVLSKSVSNTIPQVKEMIEKGDLSSLSDGRLTYGMAELTVDPQTGMSNGLAGLHPFGDLALEMQRIPSRVGTSLADIKPDANNFPLLRMQVRNGQGEQVRGQQRLIGFFVRTVGGRLMRLKVDQVNAHTGRFEMRVITNTQKARTDELFYTQADLGNKLIFGRNALQEKIAKNRVGAFRTLINLMDAEKHLDSLYGDLVVSMLLTAVNAGLFIDPSGTTQGAVRAIPYGIRALYQIFFQSWHLPTSVPLIDVDPKMENGKKETPQQTEARVRKRAKEILEDLTAASDNNIVQDALNSVFWLNVQSNEATRILDFINATAMVITRKSRVEDVSEEEKLYVVARFFSKDWSLLRQRHRALTARVDYFTSLIVNTVFLTDISNQGFRISRFVPDGSGGQSARFERDTSAYSEFVFRFFSGAIGQGAVGPAPTTAGFVDVANLVPYSRVLREVSKTKGVFEEIGIVGAGPSIASLIKTLSFGYFYEGAPYVWEPEAWVFNLFGFPLQIFGSIRHAIDYRDGLKEYAVVAEIDRIEDWLERFADTFKGGRLRAITTKSEYDALKRGQLRLIGYTNIPLPKINPDDKTEPVRYERQPVYGLMGDGGIRKVVIFGMKAFEDQLDQLVEDRDEYDRYAQLMGARGGAVVAVSSGQDFHFTPVRPDAQGKRFDLAELGLFYRMHRNPQRHFIPSYLFQEGVLDRTNEHQRNEAEVFDQALYSLFLSSLGDSKSQDITRKLQSKRKILFGNAGIEGTPLYVNTINLASGAETLRASETMHAGPNAFVGLAMIQRLIQQNPGAFKKYRNAYWLGSNREELFDNLRTGDMDEHRDDLAPSWPTNQIDDDIVSGQSNTMLVLVEQIAQGLIERMDEQDKSSITYGAVWQDKDQGITSVEENLAAYALFSRLHEITNTDKYEDAAVKVLGYLSRAYDSNNHYFRVGTMKGRRGIGWNQDYATDVQALAILAIGPEIMEYGKNKEGQWLFPGKWVASKILGRLLNSETGSRVAVQVNGQTVWGFDATNEAGRQKIRQQEGAQTARPAAIFVEASGYVALAAAVNASFFENVVAHHQGESRSNRQKARGWGESWRTAQRQILNELSLLAVRSNKSGVGFPYATTTNIRRGPWDYWRVPEAAVSAAATASYGLAERKFNVYGLNGGSWWHQPEPPSKSYIYKDYPQADRIPTPLPESVRLKYGNRSMEVRIGESISLPNTEKADPSEAYENLLNTLIKVRAWERLSATDKARIPADSDRRPTDEEIQLARGKQLLYYDHLTHQFSYRDGRMNYRVTLIPSYDDINKTNEKLKVQLKRAEQEEQVLQRGAIRILDPETGIALNERGEPISSMELPYLILGPQSNADPNAVDLMLQFLKEEFSRKDANGKLVFNIHEQQRALMTGTFRTTMMFEGVSGPGVREVRIVIEYGLRSALENMRLNEDSPAAMKIIRDLFRMRTQSGVIVTDAEGKLLDDGLIVGETRAKEILNWVSLQPLRVRRNIHRGNFANINMGDGKRYTIVFGDGLAEENIEHLQKRVEKFQTYKQRMLLMIQNLERALKQETPYWHPEWMNVPTKIGNMDPETGIQTVEMTNLLTGEKKVQLYRVGVLVREENQREKSTTFFHPLQGEATPLYTVDSNGRSNQSATIQTGIRPDNGAPQYSQVDHILETYFNIDARTKITLNWIDGTVKKVIRDENDEIIATVRGSFDRSHINRGAPLTLDGVSLIYTEREESKFTEEEVAEGIRKRIPHGGSVYVDIDSNTGERKENAQPRYTSRVLRYFPDASRVILLTDMFTGIAKQQWINAYGRVVKERSRERVIHYQYDLATRTNRPIVVIDRTGRSGKNNVEINGTTYNHVLIQFKSTVRQENGDLVSTGTNYGGKRVIEIRNRQGYLKSLQVDNLLTAYKVENLLEVPINTVDVTRGNREVIAYVFKFDQDAKVIRVTSYDLRNGVAETQVRSTVKDRIEKILTGTFQQAQGPIVVQSRTDVAYDSSGNETTRTTYIVVNRTNGEGGERFEESQFASRTDEGNMVVRVTNHYTGKTFERVIDASGHLREERDSYTGLVYQFNAEWGVSLPVYKYDRLGKRGKTITLPGVGEISHVLTTYQTSRLSNGNFNIQETIAGASKTTTEVRDQRMRLLEKHYKNNRVVHYDGSLLERPVYQTASQGRTIYVRQGANGLEWVAPNRTSHGNFKLNGSGELDYSDIDLTNATAVPNVELVFQVKYVKENYPASGSLSARTDVAISRVTEIAVRDTRKLGRPTIIRDWDAFGRLIQVKLPIYSVVPDASGTHSVLDTETTLNHYENQNDPTDITMARTTRKSNPNYVVETTGSGTQKETHNYATHLRRTLVFDPGSGFDSPIQEIQQQGNFTVQHYRGNQIYRLKNMGESRFVGGRWSTQLLEWFINAFPTSEDRAWFRMNLGPTYSTILPGMSPRRATPIDASNYDKLTFYIRANPKASAIAQNYKITFTDTSRNINVYNVDWEPTKEEEQLTTEWKKVSIPLSELAAKGLNLARLIQIGVLYGGNVGNETGAEVLISTLVLEGEEKNFPLIEVIGETTGLGAVEYWDASLTEGHLVENFFTDEVLTDSVIPDGVPKLGREGHFSVLKNKKGSIVGYTVFVEEDSDGNKFFRIWRYQDGHHINYLEAQGPNGQLLYRIVVQNENVDNFLRAWKERVYYDVNGDPKFAVNEHTGELARFFHVRRDSYGNVMLFENDLTEVKKVDGVKPVEDGTISGYYFGVDGKSDELNQGQIAFNLSSPDEVFSNLQQKYQAELNELEQNWETKYMRNGEFLIERQNPQNKLVALILWGLGILMSIFAAFIGGAIGKRRSTALRRILMDRWQDKTLDQIEDRVTSIDEAELRETMEEYVSQLGWSENQIEDLEPFFNYTLRIWNETKNYDPQEIYVRPGTTSPDGLYIMIPVHYKNIQGKNYSYRAVSLQYFVLYGAIARFSWHHAANHYFIENMIRKAIQAVADGEGAHFQEKVEAYRDVIFAMIDVQEKRFKIEGGDLPRRNVFKDEDFMALYEYIEREEMGDTGWVREEDIGLASDQILDLHGQLITVDGNKKKNNEEKVNQYVEQVQEALAKADTKAGLKVRNKPLSKWSLWWEQKANNYKTMYLLRFFWAMMAQTYVFFKDLDNALLRIGGKKNWKDWAVLIGFSLLGGVVSVSVGAGLSHVLFWTILTGKGMQLFIRLIISSQFQGESNKVGVIYWGTVASTWLFWNVFIGQVWLAGIIPYYNMVFHPIFNSDILYGALYFITASLGTFIFTVLSFFSVGWFLGGLFSVLEMGLRSQALIKADQPFYKFKSVPQWILAIGSLLMLGLAFFVYPFYVKVGLLSLGGLILISSTARFIRYRRWTAPNIDELPLELYKEYTGRNKKNLTLKRITWEYNQLIKDLYRSAKLTKAEYNELLLQPGESLKDLDARLRNPEVGIHLSKIRNKEAGDRLKFWANQLLRKDDLPKRPAWKDLKSLTMLLPSVDAFRHDWTNLILMEPTSGLTRLFALKDGYPDEYENMIELLKEDLKQRVNKDKDQSLRNEAQIEKDSAEAEKLMWLLSHLSNGVSLPEYRGRYTKHLTRMVEDWANERMQMVETTYKGFLNEKQSYREAALEEVALLHGLGEGDFTPDEHEEFLEASGVTDYKEQVEKLLNENFQILWSVGGAALDTWFVDVPLGKESNHPKFPNAWDFVYEMWAQLSDLLEENGRADLRDEILKEWVDLNVLTEEGRPGEVFKTVVQAEGIVKKLRGPWTSLLKKLKADPQFDVEQFKTDLEETQLGHALVHRIDIAFVNKRFKTGSPKAWALAVALPYIEGEMVMLFDGDTEIRPEDARKLTQVMARFNEEPDLGLLQIRQYLFNERYNAQTRIAAKALGGFWGANLRAKNKVGMTGAYGHNKIIKTWFIRLLLAIQPDHISEDILMVFALANSIEEAKRMLLEMGYGEGEIEEIIQAIEEAIFQLGLSGIKSGYEDRLQHGEGQETTQAQYATPTGKWSMGSGKKELQGSRVYERFMKNKLVFFTKKIDIRFGLGFYDVVHFQSLPGIIFFVLGPIFLGINAYSLLFGAFILMGLGMSQAIGFYTIAQFWEKYGYVQGTIGWLSFLFLEGGFFFWTTLIASQSEGYAKGHWAQGKWVTSKKDQGIVSEPSVKIFEIFRLGFVVSVPMIFFFLALAPWHWSFLFIPPLAGTILVGWYLLTKDKTKETKIKTFKWAMFFIWLLPVVFVYVVSLLTTGAGGALLLSSLFYMGVLFSFLVSPFGFNPNPLRLDIDLTTTLAFFESPAPFRPSAPDDLGLNARREIGFALSQAEGFTKTERIKWLLFQSKGVLQTYREQLAKGENVSENYQEIKNWLKDVLTPNEFKSLSVDIDEDEVEAQLEARLELFAQYLISIEKYLFYYHAWEFLLTPDEREEYLEHAKELMETNQHLKGFLEKGSLVGFYRLIHEEESYGFFGTLPEERQDEIREEFHQLIRGEKRLVEKPIMRQQSFGLALVNLIRFVFGRVGRFYFPKKEKVEESDSTPPPAPVAASTPPPPEEPPTGMAPDATLAQTPTPDAAPSVTTTETDDEEAEIRIQVDEEDAAMPMGIPEEDLILDFPQAPEEDADEGDQVVSGFAVRKGVRIDREKLKKEAKEALQTSRTQLVIQGPDHLVIRTGKDQEEPAWVEMIRQAIVYVQQQAQENEELKVYWKEILSREDNRAPPVYINLSRELDGKTAAVRLVRYKDGKPSQVQILFSEKFITTMLSLYPNNKEVVSWVMWERFDHDLRHTNARKTPEEALREEKSVIRDDVKKKQITNSLEVNGSPLQGQITTFITQNHLGELFPGFYFLFLQQLTELVGQPEKFETALRDFALNQLAAGEIPGVEQGLLIGEESDALVAKKEAIVAGAILRKLAIGAQNGVGEAQVIFQKGPIPAEAEVGRLAFVQQLLADKTKPGAILELAQTLIDSGALTFSSYYEILTKSGQSMEPDEVVFLTQLEAGLAQAKADQAARSENFLQGIESLLQANQRKKSPELIVLDSSLLKRFQEDESVLNLLESYQSQVAVVVMSGDEKSRVIGLIQEKGFTVTYEGDVDEDSLEHAVLRDANAKDEKVAFTQATIVTVVKSSSKWQWYNDFSYRVIVSKGDSPWSQWLASSAIREVLERSLIERGLTWDEVIKAQEPNATEQEFRLTDNIALISA